jgi:hypothetical protein
MEPQNTESLDDQIEQTEDVKLSSEPSEKIKTDLSSDEGIYKMNPPRKLETYPMYIDTPIIGEGIKKHVQYSLMGTDIQEALKRRYSDFYALHEKLLERWPGIFVPNIPPKVVVGNLDADIIAYRIRLLNRFCLDLSNIKYLYESEEVKLFQSNTNDVAKAIEKLPKLTYSQILDNYKKAFPDFVESYDALIGKSKILEFLSFLKKNLINLKTFNETIIKTVEKREEEIEKYIELIKNFKEYESNNILSYAHQEEKLIFANSNNTVLNEKIEKIKELLLNPYIILEIWIEEEELDTDAMICVINSLIKLQENLEKLRQRSSAIDIEQKKAEVGQTSFLKSIFKKKDEIINQLNKEKETVEDNIKNLSEIIRYSTFSLENQMNKFKEDKIANYFRHLKIFILLQRKNDKNVIDIWRNVKESLSKVPIS